jgi:transcriptional regulator
MSKLAAMYIPRIFKFDNTKEVAAFIGENSFATLVSQDDTGRIIATHIPLLLTKNANGQEVLSGHVAKANPQGKFLDGKTVLAIFQGPHAYVSSSWYSHENVPTWNYIAVHVYGIVRVVEGDELRHALKILVDNFEKGSENPVSTEKISSKYLEEQMQGIIGFEIAIHSVEAVKKLSQNRDEKDHLNIINKLSEQKDENANKIASEMKKRR